MNSDAAPEFSYVVPVSAIDSGKDGAEFRHQADDGERQALAARFGIVEIPAFSFAVLLKPTRSARGYRLNGRIVADVVQNCVVTLEPVTAHIDQPFEILLFDEAGGGEARMDSEEDFETFTGGSIDLGELAAVELALSLDPYPRAPGVSEGPSGPGAGSEHDSGIKDVDNPTYRPFAGLAALRRNR